jgi:hypothetical protein
MSQMDQELAQVEVSIEQAKTNIERSAALDRLKENKDFKEIILEGYFEREASRLVLLKADPNVQEEKEQAQIQKMIDSIGYLRQYLNMIYQFGSMAENALEQHEKTREDILAEAS